MGSTDIGDAIRDVESAQLTEEERKAVLRAMMVLSCLPPSIRLSIHPYEAMCTMMAVCSWRSLVLSLLAFRALMLRERELQRVLSCFRHAVLH